MNPALIASLAAAGLLAGWPQRAVITRLGVSPRPPALGLGDVKLAASLGTLLAWFGWRLLLAGGFAGFLLGGVFAAALLASRRAGRKQPIPFGPFMIAGAVLAVVAQPG